LVLPLRIRRIFSASMNGFDERVVLAEVLPGSIVKSVFFLYGFFTQYVLGVPAAIGNELEIILEPCRLAL
jgi:hypothetical protein